MHEILKLKFNSKTLNYKGKEFKVSQSTARLNTLEFEEYQDKIRQWAAEEWQLTIPLPNEVDITN